ncbi:GWxTD domain-containing protein [candidate division KSB1 bacterium]|nr:MAG: GWxTD domain-containing protein [candidate division KSB1 bacterium]
MRAALVILGLAVLFGFPVRTQAGYILDMDYACFRANDSLGYVEIYTAIQRSGIAYRRTGDSLTGDFRIVLDVLQNDQTAISDTLWTEDVADTNSISSSAGQFFSHVFRLIMRPGRYGLRVSMYQQDPDPKDVVADSMIVTLFSADSLGLSDIEFGSRMEYTEAESRFAKNGILIIPNPTRFFGTQLPLFYYYAEIYGLDFDSSRADSHTVIRRVLDAETGQPARPESRKIVKTLGASAVVADGFPVTALRTGTYYLELQIVSHPSGRSTSHREQFWTYRREDYAAGRTIATPKPSSERLQSLQSDFLDIVDADSALQWMRYILTKEESKRVSRLTSEGKREFLRVFWTERQKENPNAAVEYFARVVEANRRWSFFKRAGWKTDRGRVFILYGEPNNTTRNYASAQLPDHELWQYDQLEGGAYFIFYDKTGYGDLDLVHSTKRGEVYNPDWSKQITPGSMQQIGE